MEIIKTKSFELAIYKQGHEDATELFLCLPGRLDTKDYIHMKTHVEYFASKGFLAVSFDPPGTWESPGDISLYKDENYKQAVNEVISYFGNRPTVTLGHSRGGTIAMLAGVSNEHITRIVSVMSYWGPSEKPENSDVVHVSRRDLPPGNARTEEKKIFDLPRSYFDEKIEYNGLESCLKPKLFIAGSKDKLVTTEDVTETFNLSAEPKSLHIMDTEHDYRLHAKSIDEVNHRVSEFLSI